MWEELDKRAAVVFLHGAQVPSSTPRPHAFLGIPITEVRSHAFYRFSEIERESAADAPQQVPNETFKAAAQLVVSGKKRRYPNVRIVLAHLGGSTPFLAPRVAMLARHMGCPLACEEVLRDFKSFYFDTALSADPTTLAAMKTFVGSDRILYGTDFPGKLRGAAGTTVNSLTSAMTVAVSVEMVEWFTKNCEEFFAADQVSSERVNGGNAQALLRL